MKKFAFGVLAILVVILLMAAMKPDSFTRPRPVAIEAPAEKSPR